MSDDGIEGLRTALPDLRLEERSGEIRTVGLRAIGHAELMTAVPAWASASEARAVLFRLAAYVVGAGARLRPGDVLTYEDGALTCGAQKVHPPDSGCGAHEVNPRVLEGARHEVEVDALSVESLGADHGGGRFLEVVRSMIGKGMNTSNSRCSRREDPGATLSSGSQMPPWKLRRRR